MSKALAAAPTLQTCSLSSKWTGLGSVLVMTLQPGGKSAWARTPPTIEWSGSAAGRQPMRMSGLEPRATSVKVSPPTFCQVWMARRMASNSAVPATSSVPVSNA
jgi:hypothetical protein